MKTQKPDIDNFIDGVDSKKPKVKEPKESLPKFLLSIPESLRQELKIEAIKANINMSDYICGILEKRKELK